LTQRSEFQACYTRGRRFFSNRFIVFALPRTAPDLPLRSGAGVGKKTGTATRRNRVKRLLRELFRLFGDEIGPGMDVAVVPKRGIAVKELHLDNLSRELLPVLHRAAKHVARQHAQSDSGPQELSEPRKDDAHATAAGNAMPDKCPDTH
jgi:ribonuclease P protein component